MKRIFISILPLVVLCGIAGNLGAQSNDSITSEVTSPATAIGYVVKGGSTKVDLKGTDLLPQARGEAKVDAKADVTTIKAKVEGLAQPGQISSEFLTYVLWAVTPDGRTNNLGEILINDKGKGDLEVTTHLQTFSLMVTSEPYHSVRLPSELVVMKNEPRSDTKGTIMPVDKYTLMKRSHYEKHGTPLASPTDISKTIKTVPLEMYEARNAAGIARSRGADTYAPEIYSKAQASLSTAEKLLQENADKKEIVSAARQSMQFSEDSRALAADRQEQARIAAERQLAVDKARAEGAASQAVADAAKLPRQEVVREEIAVVVPATETPSRVLVTMSDVVFETGKSNLSTQAREKLTRLSRMLLIRPDLKVVVQGYTDSTGSAELNRKLSERRAQAVSTFLIEQGVSSTRVETRGLGATNPLMDNNTAKGRQKNRRVDILVTGESIQEPVGSESSSSN